MTNPGGNPPGRQSVARTTPVTGGATGLGEGTVRRIGSDALPPDQLNNFYRFPVDIQLNSQQLKLKSGKVLPLQVGMSLTANVKLRKVTYLQLLLSTFKEKADSLRQI